MNKIKFELPAIRDDASGYAYLFKLADGVISDPSNHFDISFKNCSIIEKNAVSRLRKHLKLNY
jgi:hypothetical protein